MRYTVVFIFTQDMKEVLMIHKIKGPYPNCLNGVGGKIENTDINEFVGALREVEEETGLSWVNGDIEYLRLIVMENYPSGMELYVFYTKIIPPAKEKQIEEERLEWFSIEDLLDVRCPILAGEGNIPYFINYALLVEKERNNQLEENIN